jgi:hypothetical protein
MYKLKLYIISYLSCPELDEHDDSDSTSFTMGKSEKGDKGSLKIKNSVKIKIVESSDSNKNSKKQNTNQVEFNELSTLNDLEKMNSHENLGVAIESSSTNKTRKSILKKQTSEFKDDYDGLALEIKRKTNSRLSLKFEEEKKYSYPLDTNSYTPCGLERKKTEEMKIDSQIFSKYKKILSYSGTKIDMSSPEIEKKRNKISKMFNPSKLSFNAAIDEEEEFSLNPLKYQSCNLEAFDPNLGVRKGSSILSKLRLGVTRKHTTPLFPVTKGNIDEEENDDFEK